MIEQGRKAGGQVFAALGEIVQLPKSSVTSPASTARASSRNLCLRGEAEHRKHVRLLDLIFRKADELVERRFRIGACNLQPRARQRGAPGRQSLRLHCRRCISDA